MRLPTAAILTMAFVLATVPAVASCAMGDAGEVQSGSDVGWLLVCSAMVFIMSPGVALFYGGMIRKQSMTSVMAQTAMAMGIMTVSWVVVGYSLAFSGDAAGIVGNLDHALLNGVGYGAGDLPVPELEFALFQMMFALITASIVLGACMERIRFNAMAAFLAVWSVAVYAPMAHWVWGGGLFDQNLVVLDFAGGTVVHICAAATGLALAVFAGRRCDRVIRRGHSMPMVFLGFTLLWFGWLGFNGGSGLAADMVAVNAVVTTMTASAAGMVSWALVQTMRTGHTGALGLVSGALAGLVAITPAAGYVGPGPALLIGAIGGPVCYFSMEAMRSRSGIDDALDVFGVHGAGAIWGALATGLFADPAMAPAGYEGLLYGSADLFIGQAIAVIVTVAFCFAASYLIIRCLSAVMRVRLTEDEEAVGADISEHGEPSYIIRGDRMRMIVAIVRPEKLEAVKAALGEAGISAMTITDVRGRGQQSGLVFSNRVGTIRVDEIEKTKIEAVVEDSRVEPAIAAIKGAAKTGHMGDGRIFVLPVERSVRIRDRGRGTPSQFYSFRRASSCCCRLRRPPRSRPRG